MAVFTQTDLENVAASIVKATINGFARVTVGGQTSEMKPLSELREIYALIKADLAADQTHFGLRSVKLVPPGTG